MRKQAILAASLLTVMVTACGSAEQPEVVEQIVVREPGQTVPAAPTTAQGDIDLVAMGEDVFQTCIGCHSIEAGAPSAAGPNLHGVIGREAGGLEDFSYSDALTASEITWDEASLDRFLADPAGAIPGNEMLAGAVTDAENRAAVIAYLATQRE